MPGIILFGGTLEGRKLAEYLSERKIPVTVSVATEYGAKLLPQNPDCQVRSERLTKTQMEELFLSEDYRLVIDATHPYAAAVTENMKYACEKTGKPYIRLLRSSGLSSLHKLDQAAQKQIVFVSDGEEAVRYLETTKGRILLTTGSKELPLYMKLSGAKDRIFARVLSAKESIEQCAGLGLEGEHLICMQGPFSEEMNIALIRHTRAEFIVMKDSGSIGGMEEKIQAAIKTGIQAVVIGRPEKEEGKTWEEVLEEIQKYYGKPKKKVYLISSGVGSADCLTMEAKQALQKCDLIIGAKRVLEAVRFAEKPEYHAYAPEKILEIIKEQSWAFRIGVVFSGDIGFFSGARRLLPLLEKEYEVIPVSGISSAVYFCNRCQVSLEKIKFISLHGRKENLAAAVRQNEVTFVLLDRESAGCFCTELVNYGMGEVVVWIGEFLSYPEESIVKGTAAELSGREGTSLSAALIFNHNANYRVVTPGIPDTALIRGGVPMTKEEVRAVILSKLRLTKQSVFCDIGAGTGSVSIEAARQASEGLVYAVEKNSEAVSLIEANSRKFGTDNVLILKGTAPDVLEKTEALTHAFIGGSGGRLKEILEYLLTQNRTIRIVLAAVALETVSEIVTELKKLPVKGVEYVSVSIAKSKKAGAYQLMNGQNPVYVVSCTGALQGKDAGEGEENWG